MSADPLDPFFGAAACSRRAYDDLRHGLDSARKTIQDLSHVIQAEQDRSSAIEKAAKMDRDVLTDTVDRLQKLKLQVEQDGRSLHGARKDLAATTSGLRTACGRLHDHDVSSAHALARLESTDGVTANLHNRTKMLEARMEEAGKAQAVTNSTHERHDDQLHACRASLSSLQRSLGESDQRASDLHGAHGDTSKTLSRALDITIAPALDRAEAERQRLDETGSRVETLEALGQDHSSHAACLQEASDTSGRDLQELRRQLGDVTLAVRALQDGLGRHMAIAKEDRTQIGDSCRHVQALQEDLQSTGSLVRRLRGEVADERKAGLNRGVRVDGVVDALVSTRGGALDTNDEVGDIRALLEAPRATTG